MHVLKKRSKNFENLQTVKAYLFHNRILSRTGTGQTRYGHIETAILKDTAGHEINVFNYFLYILKIVDINYRLF